MSIETQDGETLANDIEFADGFISKSLGLMFRSSIPDDYALVLEFKREKSVRLHMVFVRFDIDAVFLDSNDRVIKTVRMSAWTGTASGRAKRVIEMPAGNADGIRKGDRISVYQD